MKKMWRKFYLWITSKFRRKMSYNELVSQFRKFHEDHILALETFVQKQGDPPYLEITRKDIDAVEFVLGFNTYLLAIESVLDSEGRINNSYAFYKTYKVVRDLNDYGKQKLELISTLRLSPGGMVMDMYAKSIAFPADYIKGL